MAEIAIILTSFNRKEKTLSCLTSVYSQVNSLNTFTFFLTDDGSTDGTSEAIKSNFPNVNIFRGDGSLFWAGGMRYGFEKSLEIKSDFDFYLLLNDDTILHSNAFDELILDYHKVNSEDAIIIGNTQGKNARVKNEEFTYGGKILLNNYNANAKFVLPNGKTPQICHLGNANIMLIPSTTIKKIGFLSNKFTHGIADYEYTLRAKKNKINTYISSNYLGICDIGNNQVKNWQDPKKSTLKSRIKYLYSPKGLAYREYMYYIKTYFPLYFPQAWLFLWLKTFFPIVWEKLKK